MCLMHTDFPVPDGPRIIVIIPSGMPRLRPSSTVLRPNALHDVDELDRVLAAVVADRAVEGELLCLGGALADPLPQVDLFSGLSAHSPLGALALAHLSPCLV